MPREAENLFSGRNRTINAEDELALTSVGIDIGSSTSHLVFSRLLMLRQGSRYVVGERKRVFESAMLLTPYIDEKRMDAAALSDFIEVQYREAQLAPNDIDTGALILTGVAAQRMNARAIGEAIALGSGKLVALSAGDALEATLIAHGSGAVALSRELPGRVMAVDVGGGTSKIAICDRGRIIDRTVVDVGARLVRCDDAGRIAGVETGGERFGRALGLDLEPGKPLAETNRIRIAARMADCLFQAMGALPATGDVERALRLPALRNAGAPDAVLFSGGVAEYLYGRETRRFGDLGVELAAAIQERLSAWRTPLRPPVDGIRATVLGASQHTVQVSGNTIFVSPDRALPVRNALVVRPPIDLGSETIDSRQIAEAVGRAVETIGQPAHEQPIALCYAWQGSASYARIDAFCRGVIAGLAREADPTAPLLLVADSDIGGLIGVHLREECGFEGDVISIDGIAASDLDFVDVGALIESSGAVPVVVKSLVFGAAPAPDQRC